MIAGRFLIFVQCCGLAPIRQIETLTGTMGGGHVSVTGGALLDGFDEPL